MAAVTELLRMGLQYLGVSLGAVSEKFADSIL